MITAWNPATNVEIHFDEHIDPEYAVIYAHVTEDTNLSSAFFAAVHDKTLDEFKRQLPITRGKLSVMCGDWLASKTTLQGVVNENHDE